MKKYSKVTIHGKQYYKVQPTGADGKRVTLYARTVSALRTKEAAFRTQNECTNSRAVPTVAEYAAKQLELMQQQVQPATYAGYEAKVRLYIMASPLGDMPLTEVREDDVRTALLQVASLSQSSYGTVHMLLRIIFTAAKRNHLIEDDPTEGLSSRGGNPAKERPALTDEQVDTLLATVNGLPIETFVRIGLQAGLRREEILGLQWDCVYLNNEAPYVAVRRAWRIEHNRPVVSDVLKTDTSRRDVTIPRALAEFLLQRKAASTSDYVVANREGKPLSGTQWRQLWRQVTVRTAKPRAYTRYVNGDKVVHTITPQLGAKAPHNPGVTYSIDFDVTPHQLRHTYATNLISSGVDPKTVQYLLGHRNSKMTMDIYARVKYHRPKDLSSTIDAAFGCGAQGADPTEQKR